MKIAVISDIHANLEALKTVLDEIHRQKVDKIVCLGDVVGYGPRPDECVELVRKECDYCLMGNHDHAAVGLTDIACFNEYAKEAILWTREQLSSRSLALLKNLPFTVVIDNILFVHSSPLEPEEWHYIFYDYEARENMDHVSQPLVFIGHSHIPKVFSYQKGERFGETLTLDLAEDRYIVNVGSVGQPRDGDRRSCFLIHDTDEKSINYIRMSYPIQKTYQEILDSDLPPFLAMRLLSGQ